METPCKRCGFNLHSSDMVEDSNPQLKEITNDPERIRECLENNFDEWGSPLKLEDYLLRESKLHDIIVGNGLDHRTFALIDERNNKALAACEVLLRSLYHGGGESSKDHCIASVYVCAEHRRKGHCKSMIQNVVEKLSLENPGGQFCLWSDVGEYYERAGFSFPHSFQGEPQWNRSIICSQPSQQYTKCELLSADETLGQIVPEHQRLLRRDADSVYIDCQGEIDVTVVLPDVGLYQQLQFRALFTAEKLGLPIPKAFSARSPDGHGWISWTYMLASKKLLVLGLFGSASEMAELLEAAAIAGLEYECKVECYESSIVDPEGGINELLAAVAAIKLDATTIDRKKSLPMSIGDGIWISQGGYAWY